MDSVHSDPAQNRETVLIVDDEAETARCFSEILQSAGFDTLIAFSGEEAIAVIQKQPVDAVLMDILMPGMGGVEAAQKIKAMTSPEEFLPIVLISAYASEENKIAGLACADAFMVKPSPGKEMAATLRSLLKIRRLTRELARSKAKYQRFYENFPHLCISVRSDGLIIGCNRQFSEFFKLPKSGIEGKNIGSFLRPEAQGSFPAFLDSVVSTIPVPQQTLVEFKSPHSNDRYKLTVMAAAVDDERDGKVITLAMEDVTKQLDLEEEKQVARKQLYRSAHLASIGTLASGVAHEINNPLTAILGFSSALLGRLNNNEAIDKGELSSYLQVIHNETIRCRDIVDHLHRFARDSGESKIVRVPLMECIVNALRLVNMKALRSEITILNEIQENVWVLADANKLEQVFINLLTNCIDFCPAGSTVYFSPAPERKSTRYVRIALRDNGPGMPSEVVSKAFDPFFTTKEVGKGIGMGLAICHKIMEELNGRIDLVSEKGKGTTVILEIPGERG